MFRRRNRLLPRHYWLVVAFILLTASRLEARLWTSSDHQHTLEANFVKLENDKVTLQTPGNDFHTVRIDQLSVFDQITAKQLAEEKVHPFRST